MPFMYSPICCTAGLSRLRLDLMSASRSGVHLGPQITPAGSVGARKNNAKLATSVTTMTENAVARRRRMYSSTEAPWRFAGPVRTAQRGDPDRNRFDGSYLRRGVLQELVHEERHAHGGVTDGAAHVGALDV